MSNKVRENSANFRPTKWQKTEGDTAGAIGKSVDGNTHIYKKGPIYKDNIEYPFEEFNPILLDDYDFIDELCYEESEYYDFDEYGFDDDY